MQTRFYRGTKLDEPYTGVDLQILNLDNYESIENTHQRFRIGMGRLANLQHIVNLRMWRNQN